MYGSALPLFIQPFELGAFNRNSYLTFSVCFPLGKSYAEILIHVSHAHLYTFLHLSKVIARKGVVQRNYILPHPGHFIFFYVGLHIQYGRSLRWNQVLTHTREFLNIGRGPTPSSHPSVGRLPLISDPDCTPAILFVGV